MKNLKEVFCLLLAALMLLCAIPLSASAANQEITLDLVETVGKKRNFSGYDEQPKMTHLSGETNYEISRYFSKYEDEYYLTYTVTKPGSSSFKIECCEGTYPLKYYNTYTVNLISRYQDSNTYTFLKQYSVNQSANIETLINNYYGSSHVGNVYNSSVNIGTDVVKINNTDKTVRFLKRGIAFVSVAHQYREENTGSYDETTTIICFNVDNAASTITFMTGESSGSTAVTNMPSPTVITSNYPNIAIPNTVPKCAGKVFRGWTTEGAHRATKYALYQPGKSYLFTDYAGNTANIILYPVWDIDTSTPQVTFDAREGTGAPSAISVSSVGDVTIPDKVPTREGYIFRYWVDSLNGKTRTITAEPGSVITVTKNTTLYAVYEVLPTSLYIGSQPTKTQYNIGEELDISGLTVGAVQSGKNVEVTSKEYTITGFDSSTAGAKTVTVTYLGKSTTFDITVKSPDSTLSSVSIQTLPSKTVYNIGENFSSDGLVLTATYSDGSKGNVTIGFTCTGFSSATAGTKTITVSYLGKSTTFPVTVQSISAATTYDIPTLGTKGGVKYNQIVVVNINLPNLPNGSKVIVDGTEVAAYNGVAVKTLGRLTADKTFTVKVMLDDKELDGEQATITVPHSFFNKFAAFFAKLFQGDKYATSVYF